MVGAAAFAPAFIDRVCFQASQVLCPVAELGRGKHCSGRVKLSPSCANWICTCPGHMVEHAMGAAKLPTALCHLGRCVGIRRFLMTGRKQMAHLSCPKKGWEERVRGAEGQPA